MAERIPDQESTRDDVDGRTASDTTGVLGFFRRLLKIFRRSDAQEANGEGLLPGISSLEELIEAHAELIEAHAVKDKCDEEKSKWISVRKDFVQQNGEITESYFTHSIRAGAVLVRRKALSRLPWRERRRLLVRLDGRDIIASESEFESAVWQALWKARRTERESDYLLSYRSRKVFADMLHQIVMFLLGTVDELDKQKTRGEPASDRLRQAAVSAAKELKELDAYAKRASTRAALRWYLFGLPLGAIAVFIIVLQLERYELIKDVRPFVLIAIVAGGIGSIVSVMFRITRGQNLVVDIEQGPFVTLFAGAFRPLIGSTFGVALYVLVQGELLPLSVPEDSQYHFYAGLAFLAGFSERWAQDTIVRSAPIAPSPVTPSNQRTSDQSTSGTSDQSTDQTSG